MTLFQAGCDYAYISILSIYVACSLYQSNSILCAMSATTKEQFLLHWHVYSPLPWHVWHYITYWGADGIYGAVVYAL